MTFELVSQLTAQSQIDLEFHAHNDFGLAAANTLAAARAGVPMPPSPSAGWASALTMLRWKRWPPCRLCSMARIPASTSQRYRSSPLMWRAPPAGR
ncbi:hypothetical protein [Rhizobium azibense]|uniref:hypothetical protein n=1 Tax=Rhizobium azibense TaxID=1136135 RepID=UPI003CCB1CCF